MSSTETCKTETISAEIQNSTAVYMFLDMFLHTILHKAYVKYT